MEKKTSIILNFIFGAMFLIGFTWLITSSFSTGKVPSNKEQNYTVDLDHDGKMDTIHTVKPSKTSDKDVNWEGILTALGGIISFAAKTYFEQKNKKIPTLDIHYDNKKHPIFSIIHELRMNEIQSMNLGTPGRTLLFRHMLQMQLEAYEKGLNDYMDESFSDSTEFRTKTRMFIFKIVEDYELRWRERNIPELVIDRYKTLQQDRVKLLLADIDTIAFYRLSDELKNFDEVIFDVLTNISVVLRLSVSSVMLQTLKELNGSLKTITYNGLEL